MYRPTPDRLVALVTEEVRAPDTIARSRGRAVLLIVAFLAFVSLGLPDGVLGVAWPSVRRSFDLPLSQLGPLLAAAMTGYLVSSFSSGALVARVGVGRVLLWSSAVTTTASLTYALAPAWPAMLAGGLLTGLGAGAIDAGINAHAAVSFSPRVVSWLHAFYGVGAMAGPILMTAAVTGRLGWRGGYGLIAVLLAAMTVCFAATARLWSAPSGTRGARAPETASAGIVGTLRRPMVWMGIALFFLYTGLEVTAGQWAYSLLTEGRGMSAATAGTWVSVYWGSLTAGRLAVGALSTRLLATALLRVGMMGAPIGALLLSAWTGALGSLLALAVLGFSFAGIFPLLISETPARLGTAATSHAVGFQVAAAYLGVAALPGLVGVLAARVGLEVTGPFLVAGTVGLLVLHESALRMAARERRAARTLRRPIA